MTTGVIWARRTMKLTRGPETAEGSYHAFITGLDGMGMVDLNSLVDLPQGVILSHVIHINNNGHAIASGVISELKTYALMLAGSGLLRFIVRRKKAENLDRGNKSTSLTA